MLLAKRLQGLSSRLRCVALLCCSKSQVSDHNWSETLSIHWATHQLTRAHITTHTSKITISGSSMEFPTRTNDLFVATRHSTFHICSTFVTNFNATKYEMCRTSTQRIRTSTNVEGHLLLHYFNYYMEQPDPECNCKTSSNPITNRTCPAVATLPSAALIVTHTRASSADAFYVLPTN